MFLYTRRILKIFDLYGSKFHWYINYKPKYYTYYGGIFSILSLFSWIVAFIIFGLEDFKRTHPIITTSTVPPKGYKNIKFGEQKLFLPWRIVDYDEKPLKHKGILYPKIYYYSSRYNNETGAMKTNYTLINYKLCNETSMKDLGKELLLDIAIEDLYCIDMEDLNIGGSWNAEFMNYIRFDLYLCEDGIDYNETNINCTSYNKFEELHGKDNSWFFELLYPEIQFQPTEKNIPILILYKTYYYIFSRYSNKLDRIYLQEHILEDEQGWIFNKPNNISYWGTHSIGGENYVTGEKDILKYGSNSRLYSLKIYLNLGITFYTRKYKKLYEILSEIFPIIRAISTFFNFLVDNINELNYTKKINEFIIGIERKKGKNKNLKKHSSEKSSGLKLPTYSNKSINNVLLNNINEKNHKLNENINNNKNNLDELKLYLYCIQNLNQKDLKVSKKSVNSFGSHIKKKANNDVNKTMIDNKNKINSFENIEKIDFPLRYYLFGFFLMKIKSRKFKNSCISEKFNRTFKFFTHMIDISSYINLYKQFELFKKMVEKKLNMNEEDNRKGDLILKNNRLSNYDKYLINNISSNKKNKSITLINKK